MTLPDLTQSARQPRLLQTVDGWEADAADQVSASCADAVLLNLRGEGHEAALRARAMLSSLPRPSNGGIPLIGGLHPQDSNEHAADVEAAVAAGAEAVALRGVRAGADLQRLDVVLSVAEAEQGRPMGSTAILAFIGDNPAGLLAAGSFAAMTPRLSMLGWHGGRLATALGQGPDADQTFGTLARSTTLMAAAAAGVAALDWMDPRLEGAALQRHLAGTAADGFAWVLISTAQATALRG